MEPGSYQHHGRRSPPSPRTEVTSAAERPGTGPSGHALVPKIRPGPSSAGTGMPKPWSLTARTAPKEGNQLQMKSRLVRIATALSGLAALAVVTGAGLKFH